MANSEAQFHSELIKSLRTQTAAHAHKCSDKFVVGLPDVYSASRTNGVVWIECKFLRAPKTDAATLKVSLSEKQRVYIRRSHRAGVQAGWALCVRYGREWRYYAGSDPEVERIKQDHPHTLRKAGQALDVQWLMNQILLDPSII